MAEFYSMDSFDKGKILNLKGSFTGGPETDKFVKILEESTIGENNNVIINFEEVTYASSIVIGILVKMHKEFNDNNGYLVFANLNETLKNVFKITNVTSFLNITESLDDAKKMIK